MHVDDYQALRVLGADFRQERLTKAEEKAARLREETKRQTDTRNTRRAEGQCVLCGKPLGFLHKFAGKDRHPGCKTFKDADPADQAVDSAAK